MGIAALEKGDLLQAQAYLKQLVVLAPLDAEGWWWLGQSLTNPAQREDCFRRVLVLNPHHQGARATLEASGFPPSPPASATPPPQVSSAAPSDRPSAGSPPKARPTRLPVGVGLVFGLLAGGLVLAILLLSGVVDQAASGLASVLRGASGPSGGGVPGIALPSAWTPTFTSTPAPPTRTPIPTFATLTPTIAIETETYERRLLGAESEIARAEALTTQEKYAEAVLAWDDVLRQLPEYGEGYYQRANVEMKLMGNQRIQNEFRALLDQAHEDIDLAIALSPVVTGDHFYTRFLVLNSLALDEPFFVDRKPIWLIGLENLKRSLALGNSIPFSEQDLPYAYAALGDGNRARDEALRLIRARGPSAPPSCNLNTALAESYEILEQFGEALNRIDIAIGVCPTERALYHRALILYNLGRLAEAHAQLDEMIERSPEYGGGRYYLRSLISYDEGKVDEARTDLAIGEGNTWSREGLHAYLAGRFALADGDEDLAVDLLRYAQGTLGPIGTGPLVRRIGRELAALEASPYVATPRVALEATPMPTLQATITPRALTAGLAPTPPGSRIVDMTTGTGPLLLRSNDFPSFRFQPSTRIRYDTIESLTVLLISSSPQGVPTLQVSPWNPEEGGWGQVDSPVWGANPVMFPERYLAPNGDFFFSVRNWGDEAIQLDNIAVILVVRQPDGTRTTYGLGENS